MDALYRGKVALSKVNYQAKLEYEYVKNFGVLQGTFEKIALDKVYIRSQMNFTFFF
jgi:RP/EB family microtubule-associated protein